MDRRKAEAVSRDFPPSSGIAVGAFVRALRLHLKDEVQRSAREVFAERCVDGRRAAMKEETRAAVFKEIGRAMVAQGYVPEVGDLPPPAQRSQVADMCGMTMLLFAAFWDLVAGGLHSQQLPEIPPDRAAAISLRPILIDAAMRVAAIQHILTRRSPAVEKGAPADVLDLAAATWAKSDGRRELIIAIQGRLGAKNRDAFAEILEIDDTTTIDGWLSTTGPVRPTDETLDRIAALLARRDNETDGDAVRWGQSLRWFYALASLADMATEALGSRHLVMDFACAFMRFVRRAFDYFGSGGRRDQESDETILALADWGVTKPEAEGVLRAMREDEADERWRADIASAQGDWMWRISTAFKIEAGREQLITEAMSRHGMTRAEAEVAVELEARRMLSGFLLPVDGAKTRFDKAHALVRLSMDARSRGAFKQAVVYLEEAVALEPDWADIRQDLGALLGTAIVGRFDEGISHCRKAEELKPNWAIPLIQIGVTLLSAGPTREGAGALGGAVPASALERRSRARHRHGAHGAGTV